MGSKIAGNPRSFSDLPYEIRHMIYEAILPHRIDMYSFRGLRFTEYQYQPDPKYFSRTNPDSIIPLIHLASAPHQLRGEISGKNTTDLIWPFIEDTLAASNSSLVYEAAFAVYAHLTMAPVAISGPFAYGMHEFDEYENWLLESGASNETMTMVYAIDGILIDLYEAAWQEATAALGATELRDDFDFLADYLDPKDRSLLPDSFVNVDSTGDDKYDVFLPPANGFSSTIIVNGTLADVEEKQLNVG
ncbi:MAG: hypothetical protein Q9226_006656 [Calogaya cf. arnoldii]